MQQKEHKEDVLKHINSVDQSVQFTVENTCSDGSTPFSDTLVTPEPDRTLTISAYRKPTHTDQCLHSDSYHQMQAKYSIMNTLHHRAEIVSSTPKLLRTEKRTFNGSTCEMLIPHGYWIGWNYKISNKTIPAITVAATKQQQQQ